MKVTPLKETPRFLNRMINSCTDRDANQRPVFTKILKYLDKHGKELVEIDHEAWKKLKVSWKEEAQIGCYD